jgi:glutathione S-transferase
MLATEDCVTIKLYSGTRNASSWAMRAWLALKEAGVPFEEEIVDIRRPQRFPNLARIAAFSPPAQVPVLIVGGDAIFDSLAIMEFANDAADGRLLPKPIVARAQARALVAWQHTQLSGICARISFESAFYPFKRALTSAEQQQCARLFDWLERLLDGHRGDYLFGAISLADFALTPTAVRLGRHSVDLTGWPRTMAWVETLLRHGHVCAWLDEADALPHIWFDDYLTPEEVELRPDERLGGGRYLAA